MEEIIFATNNPHKIREIREITGDQFRILSLDDIGCREDIPEEADTIEGNASQKAWYIYKRYRKDCFADDTGLEIEALGGRPGVKSARYAGEECDPDNNIRKVLSELEHESNRRARFRTVISLIRGGKEILFEGHVYGQILESKRGKAGFGYDPVFMPDGYETSFAEMASAEKNRISHRAMAMEKLIGHLKHNTSPR